MAPPEAGRRRREDPPGLAGPPRPPSPRRDPAHSDRRLSSPRVEPVAGRALPPGPRRSRSGWKASSTRCSASRPPGASSWPSIRTSGRCWGRRSAETSLLREIRTASAFRETREAAPYLERRRFEEGAAAPPALLEGPPLSAPTHRTLGEALERAAATDRGIVYVEETESGVEEAEESYAALHDRALGTLTALRSLGVRPGEPVVICVEEIRDFLGVFWAAVPGREPPGASPQPGRPWERVGGDPTAGSRRASARAAPGCSSTGGSTRRWIAIPADRRRGDTSLSIGSTRWSEGPAPPPAPVSRTTRP